MTIHLIITDEHDLVRAGLTQSLKKSPNMDADGEAILDKLSTTPADLLLLDLIMPGFYGMDLISKIKSSYPELLVLVHSMQNKTSNEHP